jgi:hypothetical protein
VLKRERELKQKNKIGFTRKQKKIPTDDEMKNKLMIIMTKKFQSYRGMQEKSWCGIYIAGPKRPVRGCSS